MPRIIISVINGRLSYAGGGTSGGQPDDGFAELKKQLDAADADISLVNKRLDESQSM